MAGRIYLANVGANAGHRFAGPIFSDRTFEFLPIPEDTDLAGPHATRYGDLRSFYDPRQDLLEYIPRRLRGWPAHNDPEFETFTYGDNCSVNARAASLKRVEQGDFIFFISRLEGWRDDGPTGEYGFYLVGFLKVEGVLSEVRSRPNEAKLLRYGSNAHLRRGLSDDALWDVFWVFAGSAKSERFYKAVPVTRELADRVFIAAVALGGGVRPAPTFRSSAPTRGAAGVWSTPKSQKVAQGRTRFGSGCGDTARKGLSTSGSWA